MEQTSLDDNSRHYTKEETVKLLIALGEMTGNPFAENLERAIAQAVLIQRDTLTESQLRSFCLGGEVSIEKIRTLLSTLESFIARHE